MSENKQGREQDQENEEGYEYGAFQRVVGVMLDAWWPVDEDEPGWFPRALWKDVGGLDDDLFQALGRTATVFLEVQARRRQKELKATLGLGFVRDDPPAGDVFEDTVDLVEKARGNPEDCGTGGGNNGES